MSSEINAGSMADIAFLLLIFFLVTTQISEDKGLLVKLPPWSTEPPPDFKANSRNLYSVLVNAQNQLLVSLIAQYNRTLRVQVCFAWNNVDKQPIEFKGKIDGTAFHFPLFCKRKALPFSPSPFRGRHLIFLLPLSGLHPHNYGGNSVLRMIWMDFSAKFLIALHPIANKLRSSRQWRVIFLKTVAVFRARNSLWTPKDYAQSCTKPPFFWICHIS